jgi:serine/threonine protein kinase
MDILFLLVLFALCALGISVVLIVASFLRWRAKRDSAEEVGIKRRSSVRQRAIDGPSPPTPLNPRCSVCDAVLPVDAPEGLCPRCLLASRVKQSEHRSPYLVSTTPPRTGPFVAPTPADLALNLPQLEILELLGQGGMGAVYKARQTKLDRLVAVKILPPEWGKDPAFAERFAREAKALAKLTHPHIVSVYDFGESDGLFYLTMEYVHGVNLRQLFQERRLAPAEALAIIPQICDALQYAHEEGVVHRDIKPENILIDRKGRVKIADFGLAKLLDRPTAFALTGSQQVMGTPHYMAPEQIEKPREVDHRADIYSLGVVFYEMLTGELPLGRFAPPSERVGVDPRLDEVVLRALEREPQRRYQHASDVKSEVEALGREPTTTTPQTPVPQLKAESRLRDAVRQRVQAPATGLLLAGVLTVLVGIGLVGWSGWTLASIASAPKNKETRQEGFMGMTTTVTVTPRTDELPHSGLLWAVLIEQVAAMGLGTVLIVGAISMRRLEFLGLARKASALALVPLSPAWLLSLPMGLWGLTVLRRAEVSPCFDQPVDLNAAAEAGPHAIRGWLGTAAAWGMILSLLGAGTVFLPWASINMFGFVQVSPGFDGWHGIATGSAFGVAFVVILLFDWLKPLPLLRVLAMLVAGIVGVVLPALFLRQLAQPAEIKTNSMTGDLPVLKDLAESLMKSMFSQIQATPQFGPYVAIGISGILFLLGCVQLLRMRKGDLPKPTPVELEQAQSV